MGRDTWAKIENLGRAKWEAGGRETAGERQGWRVAGRKGERQGKRERGRQGGRKGGQR